MHVRTDLAEQKALGIHMLFPELCTFPAPLSGLPTDLASRSTKTTLKRILTAIAKRIQTVST
jgi:hypothetical protein